MFKHRMCSYFIKRYCFWFFFFTYCLKYSELLYLFTSSDDKEAVAGPPIDVRLRFLSSLFSLEKRKYCYDLLTTLRLLRHLSPNIEFISNIKCCICLQTLSYLAHYRTSDGESALTFTVHIRNVLLPNFFFFFN